jgi:ADP-ribose pyrophosphatase YjhB (NUDIX family)
MKPGIDYIGVGCGAFIVNEKNEVLLMKRGQQCKNNKGYWTIPGGALDYNERFHDGVKREIFEELGIHIEITALLCLTDDIMPEEKQHWVTPQYLCKIIGGRLEIKEPTKCEAIQWFSFDDFPSPLTIPTQHALTVFRDLLQ